MVTDSAVISINKPLPWTSYQLMAFSDETLSHEGAIVSNHPTGSAAKPLTTFPDSTSGAWIPHSHPATVGAKDGHAVQASILHSAAYSISQHMGLAEQTVDSHSSLMHPSPPTSKQFESAAIFRHEEIRGEVRIYT